MPERQAGASPRTGGRDVPSPSGGSQHWDAIAEAWAATGRDRLGRNHSDDVNRALVEAWASKSVGRLLKTDAFDEACSEGLSSLLGARCTAVIYVDLSLRILLSARRTTGITSTVCCDVRQLPFASGSLDAVVSNSTLDHFSDVRQITASLTELGRVLCAGGPLLLTLDNPVNPLLALRGLLPLKLLQKVGLVPYFVGATLAPSRLKRCCMEAGFQVRSMGAVLHCPRVLAVVVSRVVQRWASPRTQKWFLAVLKGFERLQRWPTKYLSGYYLAVSAVRSPRASRATPAPASDTGSSS